LIVIAGETPVKSKSAILGNFGKIDGIFSLPIIAAS
jgi:hypothetical protein